MIALVNLMWMPHMVTGMLFQHASHRCQAEAKHPASRWRHGGRRDPSLSLAVRGAVPRGTLRRTTWWWPTFTGYRGVAYVPTPWK